MTHNLELHKQEQLIFQKLKLLIGLYKDAIEDYNKTIEFKSDFSLAYCSRGWIKAELELYQEDIEDYDKAIELEPELVEAYNKRRKVKTILGIAIRPQEDFFIIKKY